MIEFPPSPVPIKVRFALRIVWPVIHEIRPHAFTIREGQPKVVCEIIADVEYSLFEPEAMTWSSENDCYSYTPHFFRQGPLKITAEAMHQFASECPGSSRFILYID